MKDDGIRNKKIAILATDGFEESELLEPKEALEEAGARVDVIVPKGNFIRAWAENDWGEGIVCDKNLDQVEAADYDGLLLPGGLMNPDELRQNKDAVQFVRDFFELHKPVAAICHAPQLLIEAKVVEGRTLTSYPSVRTDLQNAGAHWVDKAVVVDNGLVTSRSPADMKAFIAKMIEEFSEGEHEGQVAAI